MSDVKLRAASLPGRTCARRTCIASVAAAAFLLAGASAVKAQSSNGFVSSEVDVTCPIDGKSFRAPVINAYEISGVRLDLKPVGSLVAPNPLPVCPDNGFVLYKRKFTRKEIATIKPIVLGGEYQALRRQHTDYYMAAYLKERMGADNYDLGQTYLQASWEAEHTERQLVGQYRALALQKLDAFLARSRNHDEAFWTASLLVAELERMLGNFDAVERRLKDLRFDEAESTLGEKGAALTKAADQVRLHALNRDAEPALFTEVVGQRS